MMPSAAAAKPSCNPPTRQHKPLRGTVFQWGKPFLINLDEDDDESEESDFTSEDESAVSQLPSKRLQTPSIEQVKIGKRQRSEKAATAVVHTRAQAGEDGLVNQERLLNSTEINSCSAPGKSASLVFPQPSHDEDREDKENRLQLANHTNNMVLNSVGGVTAAHKHRNLKEDVNNNGRAQVTQAGAPRGGRAVRAAARRAACGEGAEALQAARKLRQELTNLWTLEEYQIGDEESRRCMHTAILRAAHALSRLTGGSDVVRACMLGASFFTHDSVPYQPLLHQVLHLHPPNLAHASHHGAAGDAEAGSVRKPSAGTPGAAAAPAALNVPHANAANTRTATDTPSFRLEDSFAESRALGVRWKPQEALEYVFQPHRTKRLHPTPTLHSTATSAPASKIVSAHKNDKSAVHPQDLAPPPDCYRHKEQRGFTGGTAIGGSQKLNPYAASFTPSFG